MTIIDFPRGGRSAVAASVRAHPTSRAAPVPAGSPPTGAWRITYEELAACCAEVVAAGSSPAMRVYDAEWEERLDWIRSRLAVLDALKRGEVS